MAAIVVGHVLFDRFEGRVRIVIENPNNSLRQSGMNLLASASPFKFDDSNEYMEKYLIRLRGRQFFVEAAQELSRRPEFIGLHDSSVSAQGQLLRWIKGLAISRPKPTDQNEVDFRTELLADALTNAVIFKKVGESVIQVRALASSPEVAVSLANAISQLAADFVLKTGLQELEYVQGHFSILLDESEMRLKTFDSDLAAFKKKNDLLFSESFRSELTPALTQLRREYQDGRVKIDQNKKILASLKATLSKQDGGMLTSGKAVVEQAELISGLRQKLYRLNQKKTAIMSEGYEEDSWQVQDVNSEIDQTVSRLRGDLFKRGIADDRTEFVSSNEKISIAQKISELEKENDLLSAKAESVKSATDDLKRSYHYLPEVEQTLTDLSIRKTLEFEMRQGLRRQLLGLNSQVLSLKGKVSILDQATFGGIPTRLSVLSKVFLGGLAAFLFFCAVFLTWDELFPTVKRYDELREKQVGLLGWLPSVRRRLGWQFWRSESVSLGSAHESDCLDSPERASVDYMVRTVFSLNQSMNGKTNIIAVTSPHDDDVKSSIAGSLAVGLSRHQKKVLFFVCRYKDRPLSEVLGGLVSGGGRDSESTDKVAHVSIGCVDKGKLLTKFERELELSEFVLMNQFTWQRIIYDSKVKYDYIVVETPPVSAGPISEAVVNFANLAVLSVVPFKTRRDFLLEAVEKIQRFAKTPLYAVLSSENLREQYPSLFLVSAPNLEAGASERRGVG